MFTSLKWLWSHKPTLFFINHLAQSAGGGCRIRRLLLCGEVRLLLPKIWLWGSSYSRTLGDAEYPFIVSLPGPLWLEVVAPDRVQAMGQIELNCLLMLNWIVWNGIVLTSKLCTYAKLNCLKWNCFWHRNCVLMLNWILWNGIVFDIETVYLY